MLSPIMFIACSKTLLWIRAIWPTFDCVNYDSLFYFSIVCDNLFCVSESFFNNFHFFSHLLLEKKNLFKENTSLSWVTVCHTSFQFFFLCLFDSFEFILKSLETILSSGSRFEIPSRFVFDIFHFLSLVLFGGTL